MPAIGQKFPEKISAEEFARRKNSKAPWVLRPAVPQDLGQLAQIEPVLFPDEAWDKQLLREEITHVDRSYVVAIEVDEAVDRPGGGYAPILGYAGIMQLGDVADLHTIGSLREGSGIGQALLAWCVEQAQMRGCEQLLLEVRVDNSRAIAFYERAGFETLGLRKNYYHTAQGPVDALVMSREL